MEMTMNVMFKNFWVFAAVLVFMVNASTQANAVELSNKTVLENHALWNSYRKRFIMADGRVVDTLNNNISHSEGQGFAMVLAVAANDRETFNLLYKFAKEKLAIRSDALFAWRYDPNKQPPVSDLNNASDGDLLIAWALLEAQARGWGDQNQESAQLILKDLENLVIDHPSFGRILKPGEVGFDQDDTWIVNPSYWVFPAFERIAELTGSSFWKRLIPSGEQLMMQHLSSGSKGAPDWIVINKQTSNLSFSEEKLPIFGYEAIRVPLYILLAETTDQSLAYEIVNAARTADDSAMLQHFNVETGERLEKFKSHGYRAITALADCKRNQTPLAKKFTQRLDDNYYPATLQLLSLLGTRKGSEKC